MQENMGLASPEAFSDFELLVDGKEAFPAILSAIENAKHHIEINMFIWRDDEIGNRMARAVLAAAERGVKVDLSIDRYGVVLEKAEECGLSFFHKRQSVIERIKSAYLRTVYPDNAKVGHLPDCESALYLALIHHPNIKVDADRFKADHSKFYIIDDEILFLGGINIEDKENGRDLRGIAYGDYMVCLKGQEYVKAFRFKYATGRDVSADWYFGVNEKVSPDRRFEMEGRYLELINAAERELHITMAYFSPRKNFIKAILAAVDRGVKVTVMIPAAANFQNDTNRKTVRILLKKSGGRIRLLFSPRMLHTKLVVSEKTMSFGSTNITKKAFCQLSELNLFCKNCDVDFCHALAASMEEKYAEATEITDPKTIKYRPVLAFFEGMLV